MIPPLETIAEWLKLHCQMCDDLDFEMRANLYSAVCLVMSAIPEPPEEKIEGGEK